MSRTASILDVTQNVNNIDVTDQSLGEISFSNSNCSLKRNLFEPEEEHASKVDRYLKASDFTEAFKENISRNQSFAFNNLNNFRVDFEGASELNLIKTEAIDSQTQCILVDSNDEDEQKKVHSNVDFLNRSEKVFEPGLTKGELRK